jgi:predicted  nucleic acid-binding Zn-ribbon protein
LLETEYQGASALHAVKCGKCGHAWSATAQSLLAGHFCQLCGRDNLIAAARRAAANRSFKRFQRAKEAVALLGIGTPNEVARFLGVSAHTVRRYARKAAERAAVDQLEVGPAPSGE